MKKVYVLLSLLVLATMVLGDTPNTIYHPYFAKTYPDPAMPGQVVRVEVTLQNMGSQTFYNISTRLRPTWPFSGNETTGFIRRLDPLETATVVYYLQVAKDAKPGQYSLLHEITYYYGEWNDAKDRVDYFKVETTRTLGINVQNRERVEVIDLDYPNQILAGGSGEIRATIKNTGSVPVNDIKISVNSNSYSLVPLAPSSQYIDVLNPGDQETLTFKFKSSSTATTGTYSMTLEVSYGSTEYSIPMSVSILGYPGLEVSSVEFKSPPEPGKETTMSVCIKNLGADLGNFYISLFTYRIKKSQSFGLTQELATSEIGEISQDLVVIGSSTKFVQNLNKGETKCFDFGLALSEDAEEKPYYLYLNFFGGNFQETSIPIGINVKGIPRLSLSDVGYDQDFLYAGTPFKMSVQFENSGTGKAKEVKVISNGETIYLGSIDPEDSSTAVFRLKLDKPGEHEIKLQAVYFDKDGNQYTQNFSVSVIVSQKPLETSVIMGVVIVIVIVGLIIYKVTRK